MATARIPVTVSEPSKPHEPCDRCNTEYSKGRWIVRVGDKELHLCNHHYMKFKWHIGAKGYEVKEAK